jgi:hypothetical protein
MNIKTIVIYYVFYSSEVNYCAQKRVDYCPVSKYSVLGAFSINKTVSRQKLSVTRKIVSS